MTGFAAHLSVCTRKDKSGFDMLEVYIAGHCTTGFHFFGFGVAGLFISSLCFGGFFLVSFGFG
ncbi:MAG: hypothetical protein A2143_07600 [Gallionellales bacterium RBG_16_57_15]|nr:MAG: hypothetical protein A2143_07600 [Gallionellales bacterium RBG_16_57_15]